MIAFLHMTFNLPLQIGKCVSEVLQSCKEDTSKIKSKLDLISLYKYLEIPYNSVSPLLVIGSEMIENEVSY